MILKNPPWPNGPARNAAALARHDLWGTGTTGKVVSEKTGLPVQRLKSGPLGGDQELGAMIANGNLDVLIFFTDPLAALPHDVDVKALLRVSTLHQVAVACNRATADFILQSALFDQDYAPEEPEATHRRSTHSDVASRPSQRTSTLSRQPPFRGARPLVGFARHPLSSHVANLRRRRFQRRRHSGRSALSRQPPRRKAMINLGFSRSRSHREIRILSTFGSPSEGSQRFISS